MSVERELAMVTRNLKAAVGAMEGALHDAAVEIAALLETYAKTHHLWRNVTGQTQATTHAEIVEETSSHILIALTSETDHAQFLELAYQGRFSWLWPAVEANRSECLAIVRKHLAGVQI